LKKENGSNSVADVLINTAKLVFVSLKQLIAPTVNIP
jgi:hypothetical protein